MDHPSSSTLPGWVTDILTEYNLNKSVCLTNEQIAEFTQFHIARDSTVASSVRAWNATSPHLYIFEQAAQKYVRHFNRYKTPFVSSKRSRSAAKMEPSEPKVVVEAAEAFGVVEVIDAVHAGVAVVVKEGC